MKNKLVELIDALREELAPNAYIKISNAVQSFSDDKQELLPFEYPVKEGYEVVTGDERKVEQLHKFEVEADFPVVGVLDGKIESWTNDGRYSATGINVIQDLFLRRVEKKVWVVEWNCGTFSLELNYNRAMSMKTDKVFKCLYEATLKPVV